MTGPLTNSFNTAAQYLEDRSYKTYQSRLYARRRLSIRGQAWSSCLVALSLATTLAGVALLKDPSIYGPRGDVLMACLGVSTLVASLVSANMNYAGRSQSLFIAYRRSQRLSSRVERLRLSGVQDWELLQQLSDEYDNLLDECENHTSADYLWSQQGGVWRTLSHKTVLYELLLSILPVLTLILPAALLMPVFRWIWLG